MAVAVEEEFAKRVVRTLEPKDIRAFRIERAVSDEVVDVSAGLEIGIQLDQWSWPKTTGVVQSIYFTGDIFGPDSGEARGKLCVLGDEPFTKGEYVH